MGVNPNQMPSITVGDATKPAPKASAPAAKTEVTAFVPPKTISIDYLREGGNTVKGLNTMLLNKGLKRAGGLDMFSGDAQEGNFDEMAKGATSLGKASNLNETTATHTSGKTIALGAIQDIYDRLYYGGAKTAQQFKAGFDDAVKFLTPRQRDVLENEEFVKSYLGPNGNLKDAAGAVYEDLVKKRQSSQSAGASAAQPMSKTAGKVMLKVKKA